VKGYPVTRDELFGLGGVGLLATFCFSVGGNYMNRSFDISKDIELAQGVPEPLVARWKAKSEDAFLFGSVLIAVGVITIFVGGAKVLSIIRSTEHPNE
jgi:heme O synthase-like polyprenyltransferase